MVGNCREVICARVIRSVTQWLCDFFGITPTAHSGGTAENLSAATCTSAWRRTGRRPRPHIERLAPPCYATGVCRWLGECANDYRGQNVRAVAARGVALARGVSGSAAHCRSRCSSIATRTRVETFCVTLAINRLDGSVAFHRAGCEKKSFRSPI